MKIFTIDDAYLTFLRQVDSKVPNSSGTGYTKEKPYVGVVLNIEGTDFLAPMSSPKPWHSSWSNSDLRHFKLHERGVETNALGVIALQFMVPTLPSVITELNFSVQDPRYKALLQMQYEYMKTKWGKIQQRAEKLYDHVVVNPKPYLQGQTCDFAGLVLHSATYP